MPSETVNYAWVAVWLIDNGSTPGLLLSTQHEDLLAPPTGYTIHRRVGWTQFGDHEDGTQTLVDFFYNDGGIRRFVRFGGLHPLLNSGGSASVLSTVTEAPYHGLVPRTGDAARSTLEMQYQNTTGGIPMSGLIGPRGGTLQTYFRIILPTTGSEPGRLQNIATDIPVDKARFADFMYSANAGAVGILYTLNNLGFYDVL
jgi:hypothetical protein